MQKKKISPRQKRERFIIGSTVGVVALASAGLFVAQTGSNTNQDLRSQASQVRQVETCNYKLMQETFTDGAFDSTNVRDTAKAGTAEITSAGLRIQSRSDDTPPFNYFTYTTRLKADFEAKASVRTINNAGSGPVAAVMRITNAAGQENVLGQIRLVQLPGGDTYADMTTADRVEDTREGTKRIQLGNNPRNIPIRLTYKNGNLRGFVNTGNGYELIDTIAIPQLDDDRLQVQFGTRAFGTNSRGGAVFSWVDLNRCGAPQNV